MIFEYMTVIAESLNSIAKNKRFLIDELKITKVFDSKRDCPIIWEMCNPIIDGDNTGGCLSLLDLSDCDIVAEININGMKVNPGSLGQGFKNCTTLKTLIIPYYTYIAGRHLSGCKSLEAINIPYISRMDFIKETNYCRTEQPYTKDGVLYVDHFYEKTGLLISKQLVKFPANKSTEFIIPSDIDEIADYAFEDCKLTSLTMPPVAPICKPMAFHNVDLSQLTIKVPKGSFDSYWVHPFYGDLKIEELEK